MISHNKKREGVGDKNSKRKVRGLRNICFLKERILIFAFEKQ